MHPVTQRLIDRTPHRLRPGVELVLRTADDTVNDRVPGLAAEVAFFVLLSLPPLLLTLLSGVGVVGRWFGASWRADAADTMHGWAEAIFTNEGTRTTVQELLSRLIEEPAGSLFGVGFLLTFLSASRALRVVTVAITIAYDLEETRPGWQQRIWGFVLTLGAIVTGILLLPLVVSGPNLGDAISAWLGGVPALGTTWRIAYWPGAAVVATSLIAALYHLAAPWWTPFRRDLPGALLAMVLWLAGSFGLRVYLARSITADEAIYQPIAGPLAILLWLYVTAFAVLLGAELNAEIEKMWPTRRDIKRSDPGAGRPADDTNSAGAVDQADGQHSGR